MMTEEQLRARASALRWELEYVFGPDTAVPGSPLDPPSAGHCAAVAVVVHHLFGGVYVSTKVRGESHWFNHVRVLPTIPGRFWFDVDLTGDQYHRPRVQVDPAGKVWRNATTRDPTHLNLETLRRAVTLMERLTENSPDGKLP
ncbi:MAG TPA: hypothetical protein VEA38_23000 [Terriglobales bacterium]|nr:hypothetical protein [Terriglobales bacterium]